MPSGLQLHIPNDNSLIHSEYECDLISLSSGYTDVNEKHVGIEANVNMKKTFTK